MKRVLILDTAHDVLTETLMQKGFLVELRPDMQRSELMEVVGEYHGLILRSRITIDKEIIDKASTLEFIGRIGAGMESIDTQYAEANGIICYNSPEGNRDAVGEHALGMLLNLMNCITKANNEVKEGLWLRESNRGTEIKGKTIGIIGYGNMGSAFAQRLVGFGCMVLAYDKYKTGFSDARVQEADMNRIFAEADILSLHVPLTEETENLVNMHYINRFVKTFYLINTARGPVVNTSHLAEALASGKILGAALDVIEYEETSFEKTNGMMQHDAFRYLSSSNRVIMTPHIAGWTVESKYKLAKVLADKIIEHYSK